MTVTSPHPRSLARRVTAIIVITLVGFMGVYAGITTILEGRRFEAAVEKDLLLLDAVITAARERLSDAYQLRDPTYVRDQLRSLAGGIPGVVVARAYDASGRLIAALEPIPAGDEIRVSPGASPSRGVARISGEEVAWLARPIHLRAALGTQEGPLLGYLVLGASQRRNVEARWTSTAVFIIVGAVTLGAMVAAVQLVVSRALLRPVRAFSERSRLVARGDLTSRFAAGARDEIGALGDALNAMVADLASMIRGVREVAGEVDRAAEQITESAQVVLVDSKAQQELVRSAEQAAEGIGNLLRNAIASIQSLSTMSEDVSRSTVELQAAIREIARAADNLSESVREVSGAAAEQVGAIQQVSLAVGQLTAFVNESAKLAGQMDETLRNVEATVRESLDLALSVTERAGRGREAVERAKAGMGQIRAAFNVTGEGIDRLRGHSVQVGEIVQVIDGVTKQVNLLALNASILAAQAGEHGKGFSVLASEIRDLAERTAVSASKIAGLVERFQADLEFCIDSMQSGREAVENGQALIEEAMAVLTGILASSQQSATIVHAITDATQRHVAEGRRIAELMAEVRERVERINRLTTEQSEEGRRILESARRMEVATRDVRRATGEQSRGSLLIVQTMDKAREIVRQAQGIASEQDRVMARLAEVMRMFQELSERNLRSAESLAGAIAGLEQRARALGEEVRKFTL
jgi:methyl-accepting chemotaxis protein